MNTKFSKSPPYRTSCAPMLEVTTDRQAADITRADICKLRRIRDERTERVQHMDVALPAVFVDRLIRFVELLYQLKTSCRTMTHAYHLQIRSYKFHTQI